jgi:hypothetical protein
MSSHGALDPAQKCAGDRRSGSIEALAFGATIRIDDHPVDRPSFVLPLGDVSPGGRLEAGDGGRSRPDPPPVLARVGAQDLDVDVPCASLFGHALPFAPGQLDGIAGVRDDADAERELSAAMRYASR